MRSRTARVLATLVMAVLAVACTKTLKIDQLESSLEGQLEDQLQTSGVTVNCPGDVKAEAGSTFECTGTLPNGDTITIRVTQKDDNGNVTWKVVDASSAASATPSA